MDFKDTYIPQHLDVPTRYMFFTSDELAVCFFPLAAGTILFNFLVGGIGALVSLFVLRKLKKGTSLSEIMDRLYWLMPGEFFRLKDTPPSYLRELAG